MVGVARVLGRGVQDRRGEPFEHRERTGRLELVRLRPEHPCATVRGDERDLVQEPRLPVARLRLQPDEAAATLGRSRDVILDLGELSHPSDEPRLGERRSHVAQPDHDGAVGLAGVHAPLELEQVVEDPGGRRVPIARVLPQQPPHDLVEGPRRCDAHLADAARAFQHLCAEELSRSVASYKGRPVRHSNTTTPTE